LHEFLHIQIVERLMNFRKILFLLPLCWLTLTDRLLQNPDSMPAFF